MRLELIGTGDVQMSEERRGVYLFSMHARDSASLLDPWLVVGLQLAPTPHTIGVLEDALEVLTEQLEKQDDQRASEGTDP